MPAPAQPAPDRPEARADVRLALLCAVAPCLWFVALNLLYALGDMRCSAQGATLWSLWALSIALSLAAGARLSVLLRRSQAAPKGEAKAERVRFMLHFGLALNALSVLLLGGMATPLLRVGLCE